MPEKTQEEKNIEAKKYELLDTQPSFVIFEELRELNSILKDVVDTVKTSTPTEITVNNPEDIKTELNIPEVNFEPITTSIERVLTAIKDIKSPEFSGIEKLLSKIANKEQKDIDLGELNNISDILNSILSVTQNINNKPQETTKEELNSILNVLKIINDNVSSIETPEFDYFRLAKVIKDNIQIKVNGGGGIKNVNLEKKDGTVLNPATEEKQDDIITKLASIDGKDFATEITLSNVVSELQSANTNLGTINTSVKRRKMRSTGNTTTTPLAGGATYTGAWIDVRDYIQVIVSVITDQDSASQGLVIEQSTDGVTADMHSHTFSININTPNGHHYPATIEGDYIRVKYTNGAVAQSTFKLYTVVYSDTSEEGHTHGLDFTLEDDHPAQIVRNVNSAKNPSGSYVNIGATAGGNLKISLEEFESGISVNSNTQLRTTQYKSDGTEKLIGSDGESVGIDYSHHKIHSGTHYLISDIDEDVDIATPKYWHLKAPNTAVRVHLVFDYRCTKNAKFELFETPTLTGNGTALTAYNSDRNSSNTSTLLAYYDPTVSADGTRIKVEAVGDDNANPTGVSGEHTRSEDEIILKQNTSYLLKFTAVTDNMRISIRLRYYED